MNAFQKATKERAKGRMALIGPSGSGKTYTALKVAQALGNRIALIDTEKGSASKYADEFDFDVCELDTFSPERYVEMIQQAALNGYDVLIIDSLSHAWSGKDGALEQVDNAAARTRSQNRFTAWREVTPMHNRLIDSIVSSDCHVIATMRVKTEWVLEENEKGKKVPRKVGLAPIQRDGMEYEFDVVVDLDADNQAVVSKARCSALNKQVYKPANEKNLGATFASWLAAGVEPRPKPQASARAANGNGIGMRLLAAMEIRCEEMGISPATHAKNALSSICQDLGCEKTAEQLSMHEASLLDQIQKWKPQTSNGTLGSNTKAMRALHAWVNETLGFRGQEGHDLLHSALPEGIESLSDLPLTEETALRERCRQFAQQQNDADEGVIA